MDATTVFFLSLWIETLNIWLDMPVTSRPIMIQILSVPEGIHVKGY